MRSMIRASLPTEIICSLLIVASLSGCKLLPTRSQYESAEPDEEIVSIFDRFRDKRTPKMLVDFGNLQLASEHYTVAEPLFEEAIEKDESFLPAYLSLARLYERKNEPKQALAILRKAERKCEQTPDFWNELGVAHSKLGEYDKASEEMEKAIEGDPTRVLFKSNLAGVLAMQGKERQAFELYADIFSPGEAHYRIAGFCYSHGRDRECVEHLKGSLECDPENSLASEMLSRMTGTDPRHVSQIGARPGAPTQTR
ncbi:tetratricopeptide repeat protein [Planctomycetes bacterium Pan216]|uniref:Tetratricopeptide repeat protein n=1 Tax=Kolteria novifilia TaxID=2527975 RepID=A0A518BCA8_9BACT|nr:tetratricopeptide repeat protein [Planctomycetes bacterium Pan216]